MRVGGIGIVLAAALAFSSAAMAANGSLTANVDRVMVSDPDVFGGCMVKLTQSPQSRLPGCANAWLTFSCSGDFGPKDIAYRKLDQAQLAFATGKRVQVFFTDDQKHNGYCFATRIDVRNN